MVPLAVGQRREILMPGRMLLKGDLGRFFDAATDSHIAALCQFDLEEKDEFAEHVDMLEQEEFGVAAG